MRWSARNTLLEGYYRRNIQKLPPSKGKESYNYGKRAHSTTASEYWKTLTNQGQIDFFIDLLARATESTDSRTIMKALEDLKDLHQSNIISGFDVRTYKIPLPHEGESFKATSPISQNADGKYTQ